ncbi:cysteine hydrolase family protein [Pseudonocardia sp. MH-G8]|uniref:cysteine hydrolase family protein n=1 Tax=Pseudonocardia sp. MH-G8 TaxID=1854588 RepID=UPI000B9FC90A|nr:isochorismatase family protein [Pseudonocardia sp. MH-G8]OZM77444.1 isochorismatase [Pseudonocardia sp. MH-G8]
MTAALVVGDLQVGITRDYAFSRRVLPPVAALLPRARAAGVLPVFVRTAFRPNRTDLAETNPLITAFFDTGDAFREGAPETEVDPALVRDAGDVTVLKRRASAFAGTDLDLVLRARGIDEVVLTGVATSAMIAATAYAAADRDYRVTVLQDCCADADDDLHDAFVRSIFPARGMAVVLSQDWAPA